MWFCGWCGHVCYCVLLSITPVKLSLIFFSGVIQNGMPGKRDPSQIIITASLSRNLLALVDSARVKKLRGQNRAQFIRDALADKLMRLGIHVPDGETLAPDRVALNDAPSSEPIPERVSVDYKTAKKKAKKKP